MGRIVCEMCGNSDLLKEGDYFVCQFCSAKYTVEDARKMMIEGTVDVQGTVKVDNSDFIQKYLQNARRAKQKEDWEEVVDRIMAFMKPVWRALCADEIFFDDWMPELTRFLG